jgi:hypothetical protein
VNRLARGALASAVVFVVLVLVLSWLETTFDNPVDTRNRLGVVITALSAIAAAVAGAWQARSGGRRADAAVLVAAVAPPAVLSVVLALFSGAGTEINIALAVAGVLGAAGGAFFYQSVRA